MTRYLYSICFKKKDGRMEMCNPIATGYQEALTKAEQKTGLKEGVDGTMVSTLQCGQEVHVD